VARDELRRVSVRYRAATVGLEGDVHRDWSRGLVMQNAEVVGYSTADEQRF
jgi:hypothetical protein